MKSFRSILYIIFCTVFFSFHVSGKIHPIDAILISETGDLTGITQVVVLETSERIEISSSGHFQFHGEFGKPYSFAVNGMEEIIRITQWPADGKPIRLVMQEGDMETIVVTASAHGHVHSALLTPTSVMAGDDILVNQSHNIAQTLKDEPGVHVASYGVGAGRPVIRGLSGNRVSVLTNLMPSLDASATSPDHAISGESLRARQIEILRGPKTLRFGSAAIGGVINIVDDRIPQQMLPDRLSGQLMSKVGTGGQPGIVFGQLSGSANNINWYTDVLARRNSDLSIGSTSQSLTNSDGRSSSAVAGVSVSHSPGNYVGIALEETSNEYGLPLLPGESEQIRLDVSQSRTDFATRFTPQDNVISHVELRFADNDYEHVEIEEQQIGTRFINRASQLRVEARHNLILGWQGTWGLQQDRREFQALGEEAFVPPSVLNNTGFYFTEVRDFTRLSLEVGARLERQTVESDALADTLTFNNQSASVALHVTALPEQRVSLFFTHAQRSPGAEELLSDGPHLATQSWESGNAALRNESSNNIDLNVSGDVGPFSYSVDLFHNQYKDFIFEQNTGNIRGSLVELAFTQADARFYGYELQLLWTPARKGNWDWQVELLTDDVFARFRDGDWLPRIPPGKTQLSVTLSDAHWNIHSVLTTVREQTRVSDADTVTPGYTDWTVDVTYNQLFNIDRLMVFLSISNILDTRQLNHASFIRDRSPFAGRALSTGLRYAF